MKWYESQMLCKGMARKTFIINTERGRNPPQKERKEMENIIKNVATHELMILDREGIEYTILNIEHKSFYDLYEIRIDCDELYYKMVLHAIRRS